MSREQNEKLGTLTPDEHGNMHWSEYTSEQYAAIQTQEAATKMPDLSIFERRVKISDAARNTPPAPNFTIPGFQHRTTGIIVSAGGTGKSYFAMQSGVSVALGRDIFGLFDGEKVQQGPVVILNVEDQQETLQTRLHYILAGLSDEDLATLDNELDIIPLSGADLTVLSAAQRGTLQRTQEFSGVVAALKARRPRLVILDTLSRISGVPDENDNAAAASFIRQIDWLNKEVDCSTLLIHHANKNASYNAGGSSEQQAARGASALTDNARWQLNMTTMSVVEAENHLIPDDERRNWVRLDYTKLNYGPPRPSKWLRREFGGVLNGNIDDSPLGVFKNDNIPEARKKRTGKRDF